jgi:hypothetical protein
MWRDSRKYGIWPHVICQLPALLPPGILSSCNNLAAAELKNPKDRDPIVAALPGPHRGWAVRGALRLLARPGRHGAGAVPAAAAQPARADR